MTAAISRRPWPTFTTIAPPAASRYSWPFAAWIVDPTADTATGGSAIVERRKTRPLDMAGMVPAGGIGEPSRPERCTGYGSGWRAVHIDDADLITRARSGDVAAYEELVHRYQDVAVRTAYLVCPEADADDAVQESFLKAFAALPRFRDGSPLR